MKITFKKLAPKDYTIISLYDEDVFTKELERDFSEDECWLIMRGRDVMGYCALKELKNEVFLSRSASFESGCGVHRKSIMHRLRWAKRRGHKTVITYVSLDNRKSLSNLIRCGFQIYTPHDAYAGDDFIYLQKDI